MANYDYKPAIDRPERVIARLNALAKGQSFSYHFGDIRRDRTRSGDVDRIAALAARLEVQGKIRVAMLELPGRLPHDEGPPQADEIIGGGFEYVATGTDV